MTDESGRAALHTPRDGTLLRHVPTEVMNYWIYDAKDGHSFLHSEICYHCCGPNWDGIPIRGWWIGPFESRRLAMQVLEAFGRASDGLKRPCDWCNP